jgi:hypothetical protein
MAVPAPNSAPENISRTSERCARDQSNLEATAEAVRRLWRPDAHLLHTSHHSRFTLCLCDAGPWDNLCGIVHITSLVLCPARTPAHRWADTMLGHRTGGRHLEPVRLGCGSALASDARIYQASDGVATRSGTERNGTERRGDVRAARRGIGGRVSSAEPAL